MATQTALSLSEFAEDLKDSYKQRQLSCEEQWPPVSMEKLVNLQLVEAKKKEGYRAGHAQHGACNSKAKRTPILYGDLFKVEEGKKPVRKLIVEGNAGAGKTTLCTMLTEDWAEDKIFNQFDYVFLLPLRNQLVSSASSLLDLLVLYHPHVETCKFIDEQLKRKKGKGVLIIADGWDELSEEQQTKGSFIYTLLFGHLLPSASILLTSRPSASAPLHNLHIVDRFVEVVGFSEENIKEYIGSQFEQCPEKASSLIKQLENNPAIQSVCSVPLNCAIVCHLWDALNEVLPSTLTELYAKIVLNIILRDLKKINPSSLLFLENFDSIPVNFQSLFWLTCRFAYECLSQDQIVFSESELASFFPEIVNSSGKFLRFGLLQSARSLLPVGHGLSFHFTHLTIQEYLAALHLVTLSNEEKLKICVAHARSDRFAMVWRFVFGLGCKKEGGYSRRVVFLDDEIVDRFVSSLKIGDDQDHQLLLCHCSMECSYNTAVSNKIAKRVSQHFKSEFGDIARTPSDCLAVFHVLSHTLHCSYLNVISLTFCGLDDLLLIKLTDILSSAHGTVQIAEILLYNNKLVGKGVSDLFYRARALITALKELDLDGNNITDMIPLPLSSRSLKHLYLSKNPLGASGIQALETAIQTGGLVNLERLVLSHTLIDNADVNGKLLTTLLPSIATHCPHLKDLNLSNNNLGVPGACAVAETFSLLVSNKDEFELNLSDTNMNGEAAVKFSNTLISKPCDSSCKCELHLSKILFGIDGLLAIFKIISSKACQVAKLIIRESDFTIPESNNQHVDPTVSSLGCINLVQFSSSNILKYLDFRNSHLGETGVKSLNKTIQTNGLFNLERLDLTHTLFDSADLSGKLLTTLLPSLATHCPHLKDLGLSKNNLGVPGACAVAKAFSLLVSNRNKFELNLSDTNMSGEAAVKFSDILTSKPCDSSCKCELDLSNNPLGIDGLSAILKIVSSTSYSVSKLHIWRADFTTLESPHCNIQYNDTTDSNMDLVQFSSCNILKHLHLWRSHLGESGVVALNTAIQTGGLFNLERLDLSHTLIDSADVNGKLLTTLLPSIATHCPHLKDLNLSNNNLGVPGACAVGEAFSLLVSNKDKFELNLSDTNMSREAAVKFSGILTSRPCDSLCECKLELSANQFGMDGLSAIFKVISSKSCPVATLTIRKCNFTVPGSNICDCETKVSGLGTNMIQFSSCTVLKYLDVSDSHLGESGVKSLNTTIQTGGLVNLERLNLSHTLIDSADVNGKLLTTLLPSIATYCPHLEDLDLSKNNLGVPGACAVGEAFSLLVSNKDTLDLNLSDTNLSGEAAVRFSGILTSRPCDSLCECKLELSENQFGMDGLSAIFKVISSKSCPVATLTIRKCNFTVPGSNICDCETKVSGLGTNMIQFSSCTVLKYLDVSDSHLGESGVKSLNTTIQTGGLVNLERLNLSHTLIDSADVNGKLLTTLLPSIATYCPHLEDLDLSKNNLGVPGACAVGEAFSLLVSNKDTLDLILSDTNLSGEAAVRFSGILTSRPCDSLCECKLELSENQFGIDGFFAIFKIFLIKSYQIARLEIRRADFSSQLNFESSRYEIQNIEEMACDLCCKDLVQLKYVDLRRSQLGELSVKLLNTIIQRGGLVNIERLDLSHTLFDSADVNGKLLTTLLPSIATHCPHLKKFNLSANNLGVPGACDVWRGCSKVL